MSIRDFYNTVAPEYEELISSPLVNATLLPNLKKIFEKYFITEGAILDLGCGPGNLERTLGDSFSYTGIDISEKMLQQAQMKGYTPIKGLIEKELPSIPDRSFDYVVSLSALHFVEDIDFVVSELNRISRKGWIISLANITKNYKEYFSRYAPVYNHCDIHIEGIQEDSTFDAWASPGAKETIKERLLFKKMSGTRCVVIE